MDGFSLALARKLNLNSHASLPKDEIGKGFNQLYHIRAGPYRVVGETQHIKALGMPYRAIWAQKAATCSARSKLREMEARGDQFVLDFLDESGSLKGAFPSFFL
ncbi:hypothetical protein BHM03_00017824 [Ensete ventricosum]|nr:hypothetical protein BHM03_00017824 [Ensete ventricosum]